MDVKEIVDHSALIHRKTTHFLSGFDINDQQNGEPPFISRYYTLFYNILSILTSYFCKAEQT